MKPKIDEAESVAPAAPTAPRPPKATVLIEPIGPGSRPREHAVKVTLPLGTEGDAGKYADKTAVLDVARHSLEGFGVELVGGPDRRGFSDVTESHRRGAIVTVSVVGVEGSLIWPDRPPLAALAHLHTTLTQAGYRVSMRENRECAEPTCGTDAMVEWNRGLDKPSGWYSNSVCGKHNYRTCATCQSVYVLTSTNAQGHAPSVHCEVCGNVIVEWGGTKVWDLQLKTRGRPLVVES